jgi:glycosyltransferase involved in cell wall biosynthesis
MEYLIQSPDECIRMGINFKENLIRKYSWDDIIDKWIKVYEEFTL